MNNTWNPYDIFDLEYFCRLDDNEPAASLHRRDRQLFLEIAGSGTEEDQPRPLCLLAHWLRVRRRAAGNDQPLPATILRESFTLLRLVLLTTGLISGCGAGLAFFSYSGTTPVNVLHFLVLFVCSQLALVTLLVARSLLARIGLGSLSRSLFFTLATGLAVKMAGRLSRQASRKLGSERRLALEAAFGRLRSSLTEHGSLLTWPVFLTLQLAGVTFNLGLLAATLFKVVVSDLAFGWQSTLTFSSQTLYEVVSWVALPWRWLFPEGIGTPTLAQIEGSHIILKEGIAHLQTPDLVSWWPFLLLTVLFYGLGIRLVLAGFGSFFLRRHTARPVTDSAAAQHLLRRMQTPLVSSQGAPEQVVRTRPRTTEPTVEKEQRSATLTPVRVLVPDELFDSLPDGELDRLLAHEGLVADEHYRFMVDYQSDRDLLERLGQETLEKSGPIVIVMEAWMPPLVDFLSYLRELRGLIGRHPIMIRLIGKPETTTPLTPVADQIHLRTWQQKLEGLGDPRLTTRALIETRPS